jgi:hypothetical protein
MHMFKFLLLLVSFGVTLMLVVSLLWHVPAAWNAPHIFRATGTVLEVQAPPLEDADRVPSNGPKIVVEFKDPKGVLQRETYSSFNSGGATEFTGRKVGETFQFDLESSSPTPNSRRRFDWQNAGKVHWALGGTLVVIGTLLYVL